MTATLTASELGKVVRSPLCRTCLELPSFGWKPPRGRIIGLEAGGLVY